jgi:cytosolic iron-sulfur protein assembly protein CIAO1
MPPPSVSLEPICVLEGHTAAVWHVAWHPTLDILATCSSDKTVRIWTLKSPNDYSSMICSFILENFSDRTIRCVNWSNDGKYLASSSFDSTTIIWGYNSSKNEFQTISKLEGHENEVKCCVFSNDEKNSHFATCSRDKSVWIWAYDEANEEYDVCDVCAGHTQDVKSLIWHPTRALLLSCSYDDTMRMWGEEGGPNASDDWVLVQEFSKSPYSSVEEGNETSEHGASPKNKDKETIGHESTVWGASFSPSGDNFASVSDDKSIILWGRDNELLLKSKLLVPDALMYSAVDQVKDLHDGPIYSIDWTRVELSDSSMNIDLLLTCSSDGAIKCHTLEYPGDTPLIRSTHSLHRIGGQGTWGLRRELRSVSSKGPPDSRFVRGRHVD